MSKREGDGATPRALLRPVVIHVKRGTGFTICGGLPARTIRPCDGWCDDPRSRRYNKPITLPSSESHERMWREDGLYDCVIETDWNRRPAIRGRGSAIFLHIARPGFAPTEGCIAFSRKGMKLVLARLGRFRGLRVI
jgi:L,D-peptidoglycan transpeptidase YkuD (ErfK/YbiS/YcfS/YnhG family)